MTNKRTPFYDWHLANGGKIVPFAGYDMPIQYTDGLVKEHEWVRANAGLFDVSHMGQVIIRGAGAAEFLSKLTPTSFINAPAGQAKYTVLTNEDGGIIDDLIITRISEDEFFAVINAGCKEKDIAWIKQQLPENIELEELPDRALVAIQGPKAQEVISSVFDDVEDINYMSMRQYFSLELGEIFLSRLGYTGEDGFEISIESDKAVAFWSNLLQDESIRAIGLGARDTLRLEMGYPLYGHDIDHTTSPVEANLGWVVSKGHSDFIGADRILKEKAEGASRKRVGVVLTERGIAREGAEICDSDGQKIGVLTSGGFSPTLKQSIGQGYVPSEYAKLGADIQVKVRDKLIAARIEKMPFVAPKTKAMKKKLV